MAEPQTPPDPDLEDDRTGPDDVYNPSAVEVTRGREQGLGVGARDLQLQGDPAGGDDETETSRLMRATAPTSGLTDLPDTDAQTAPDAQPTYPAIDGDDAETAGDSEPDGNRESVMPHGNVDSMKATAQNAVTDPESGPNDQGRGENAEAHGEAKSYVAHDVRDASMAAPAAGEVGDYADLDAPSEGMAQGRTHTNRGAHAHRPEQGPKTTAANKAMSGTGSPDQGTH